MPDVRLPDGTIIKNVPEGTTRAQLMARLQKAPQKARGGILGGIENVLSSGNELLLGAGEGIYNAASAITDPVIGGVMNLISKGSGTRARAGADRGRRAVVNAAERAFIPQANPVARTVGRIGGAMALPIPKVVGAGRLIRGANRAIQGAAGGAGVREVDESALGPAGIGAATNVVLPPIISAALRSKPAQAVAGAVGRMAGIAPPAVADDALAPLGREAQARMARFKSLGIDNPTTGMVTRDPAAYSFEVNKSKLAGVGDDLAQQMREVETKLVEKGHEVVRKLGGASGQEATGKAVEDVLDTKRAEMQAVTSRLYNHVRETRGDVPVGDLQKFRGFLESPDVADDVTLDALRQTVERRIARYSGDGMTIKQAEDLRKLIGRTGSNIEPSVKWARGKFINALDDDVIEAVGDDAFKAARASALARFEEFSKTFPGKLADEKVAPEVLTRRILGDGVKLSDLRALKQSLTSGTDEQIARGHEAWRGLQAQAVDDLLSKAIDADGNLRGAVLSREFNKGASKLNMLLGPKDFKILRRLAAATHDVKALPSGHSVNTSNTAVTLANLFDSAPAPLRRGWAGFLGRIGARAGAHAAAATAAGPLGNVAVEGIRAAGGAAVAAKAEREVAEALLGKIKLARDPEAAATAIREAQAAAASNPAIADFLNRAGLGRLIGGVAAAPSQ